MFWLSSKWYHSLKSLWTIKESNLNNLIFWHRIQYNLSIPDINHLPPPKFLMTVHRQQFVQALTYKIISDREDDRIKETWKTEDSIRCVSSFSRYNILIKWAKSLSNTIITEQWTPYQQTIWYSLQCD